METESTFFRDYRKPLLVLLVLASLFLAVRTISAIKSWGDNTTIPTNLITVNGTSEVFAQPDTAVFTFSVTEQGKTVADAQKLATDKSNKVFAYLKTQGIEEKDIKTTGYNIYPRYEYPQIQCVRFPCPSAQTLVGYEVSQSVEVKVRKTEDAGKLLSGIGSQEVQNISGLEFRIDDEQKVIADARAKAIEDAKTKAEVLADQLGVRLGRIVNFSESGMGNPMYYAKERFALGAADATNQSAPAPQLPMGENKVVSNVSITYEIR